MDFTVAYSYSENLISVKFATITAATRVTFSANDLNSQQAEL